ncbi:MAG: hypothetical protein JXR12_19055 [Neptunomonas phycophila]|uniref:hypothetical protein n=1 Tax=Neptunomonas phycophila TaxID=1572645 RepID=UPI003B8C8D79
MSQTALDIVLGQINARRAIFKEAPLDPATQRWVIVDEINVMLSPENLHADGERSQAKARALGRQLELAKQQAIDYNN